MITIHSLLFYSHIVFGSMALLIFWIPIAARKGGLNHQKFGRYYGWTMYAVALSGALMATMVLVDPMQIKGHQLNDPANQARFVSVVRIFWGFLLFLSLVTFVSVRQGFAVLKHKTNTAALRTFSYVAPLVLLIVGGVIMLSLGIMHHRILHIVFGCLGISLGAGMLRYCYSRAPKTNQWLVEHFGAMIGSGIGAYTAFVAFGGRRLFTDLGQGQLLFWIAPGVVGSIAIFVLSRKYQPKVAK